MSEWPSRKNTKLLLIIGILLCVVIIPFMQYFTDLSGFPANFISSQLSFDGDLMKSFYSTTNIEIYRISPLLDYIFMIGYGLALFSLALIIARRFNSLSVLRKSGYFVALAGIVAATCDGIENLFILIMLTDPLGFPNILVIIHSIFSLIKWILLFLSIIWVIITGIYSLFRKN